jgi:hypothetical protein
MNQFSDGDYWDLQGILKKHRAKKHRVWRRRIWFKGLLEKLKIRG